MNLTHSRHRHREKCFYCVWVVVVFGLLFSIHSPLLRTYLYIYVLAWNIPQSAFICSFRWDFFPLFVFQSSETYSLKKLRKKNTIYTLYSTHEQQYNETINGRIVSSRNENQFETCWATRESLSCGEDGPGAAVRRRKNGQNVSKHQQIHLFHILAGFV